METKRKILAVEPDAELLKQLARLLNPARYSIFNSTAAQALRFAEQVLPDIVVLDLAPLGASGTELCRQIKQQSKLSNSVVVHVSGQLKSIPGSLLDTACGGDFQLHRPITDEALLTCVEAMFRLKAVQEKLNRTEQLWRTVFARTRDAVLLVDHRFTILDANPKAEELYQCQREQMQQNQLLQFCPEPVRYKLESKLNLLLQGHAMAVQIEQQSAIGTVFKAEIQARHFRTGPDACFEVIVCNLEEDSRADSETRTIDREIGLLSDYSVPDNMPPVAASMYGGGPLSRSLPAIFQELQAQYARLMEVRIEQRAYKSNSDASQAVQSLIGRLGFLRAGPRDIVELHTAALKQKMVGENPRKKLAYHEEGRFMLLELLGHLAVYYRERSLGSLGIRSQV